LSFGLVQFYKDLYIGSPHKIRFEGSAYNDFETFLTVAGPTADRTITLRDASGTILTTGNMNSITDIGIQQFTIQLGAGADLQFEGATANAHETTLTVTDPTADRTITLPDATGTILTTGNSDTPTTTTSSSDADFVLVDDGGTMKKITPSNLGIGGGSSAADDITAGDAAVNITTTSGNITIDAQENNSDIIFKGTKNNSDITFATFDGASKVLDLVNNGTNDITGLYVAGSSDFRLYPINNGTFANGYYYFSGGLTTSSVKLSLPNRAGRLSLQSSFVQVYLSSNSAALTSSYAVIIFDEVPEQNTDSNVSNGVTYNTSTGEFTFVRDGYYQVHADITTDVTSGSDRSDTQSRLEKSTGGSFSQVAGTEAHAYNRNVNRGEQTMSINMIIDVNANDKIRFTCKQAGGTDTVVIRGDATRANIVEIT